MKQHVETSSQSLVKTDILGTQITNSSASQILEYIFEKLQITNYKLQIVTPNPEIIVYARKHPEFQKVLNHADISLADGVGVILAASLLGRPLKERIAGVDFMEALCQKCASEPITVGFLGAGPGVAQATAECLKKKYPGLQVSFAAAEIPSSEGEGQGEGKKLDVGEWKLDKEVRNLKLENQTSNVKPHPLSSTFQHPISNTDILFVAFGFPKQEEWIAENLDHLPVRVAMGVGGAFDYSSGKAPRAPLVVRLIGFEWLYRLITQPWRWRRQIALLEFTWLTVKEMFQ